MGERTSGGDTVTEVQKVLRHLLSALPLRPQQTEAQSILDKQQRTARSKQHRGMMAHVCSPHEEGTFEEGAFEEGAFEEQRKPIQLFKRWSSVFLQNPLGCNAPRTDQEEL
ncbi:hypothetical protein NHX12_007710 [Muraenolepis orangiensis]|uniref:Uncharacterized protein n=1 Tax=Muraenolepis orangiensis TaxID=630683 RepID=A0A9Q0DQI2_9TELE|nr:hypothetical protein NHX12_007710 [Muraenolepis orangiensis]